MKIWLLLIVLAFTVGCVSTPTLENTCDIIKRNSNISDFYTFSKSLPNESRILTWWDLGQCIKRETGLDSILIHYSKEGCISTGYQGECPGPFESNEKFANIAKILFTSNESEALCISKKYNATYIVVTSDLIAKSHWWTYFATWGPGDKNGTSYAYSIVQLNNISVEQNATIYTYPVSQFESFIVYDTNGNLNVFLQQQNRLLRVSKFVYFPGNVSAELYTQNDAEIDGIVWIEPGNMRVMFISQELENSMFTKMFLFNGQGLQNFEYVNSWGGEVTLFKINYQDKMEC